MTLTSKTPTKPTNEQIIWIIPPKLHSDATPGRTKHNISTMAKPAVLTFHFLGLMLFDARHFGLTRCVTVKSVSGGEWVVAQGGTRSQSKNNSITAALDTQGHKRWTLMLLGTHGLGWVAVGPGAAAWVGSGAVIVLGSGAAAAGWLCAARPSTFRQLSDEHRSRRDLPALSIRARSSSRAMPKHHTRTSWPVWHLGGVSAPAGAAPDEPPRRRCQRDGADTVSRVPRCCPGQGSARAQATAPRAISKKINFSASFWLCRRQRFFAPFLCVLYFILLLKFKFL